jgi:heme oxygenase
VGRLSDRLAEETRSLQEEVDSDAEHLLDEGSADAYRRFLTRTYGFVSPLERSLTDTAGIERVVDPRRLRKHLLLEHDLQTLGLRSVELKALPQCMSIPWFDSVHDALGWAYVSERGTLAHANLFRLLAAKIPGEIAFASSYLKCYFGSIGEMWRSFTEDLEAAVPSSEKEDQVIEAAKAAFRHFRRWRNTLDGKALSVRESLEPTVEMSSRGRG